MPSPNPAAGAVEELNELVEALKVPGYKAVCHQAEGFAGLLNVTRTVAMLMFVWAIYDRFVRHVATSERPNYLAIMGRLALVGTAAALYDQVFDGFVSFCDDLGARLQGPDFLLRVGRMFLNAEVQLVVKASAEPSLKNIANLMGSIISMPFNLFIGQTVTSIAQGSFYAIRFLRDIYLVALRASGPLFLGFYVHDKTRRLAVGWMEHVINVSSWPIWMGLLVRIQLAFVENRIHAISTYTGAAADCIGPRWFLFQSIVLVLMLLMIPTVMNRVVRGIGLFR